MANYEHLKQFTDSRGLDLRSSEVTRPKGFNREDLNLMDSPQGAPMPRYGHHIRSTNYGWAGMWQFKSRTMLQEDKDEIIGAGGTSLDETRKLWKQSRYTVTFANTNAAITFVSFYYDSVNGHFTFTITRSGSVLLAYNTAAKTFAQLQTAVAAISGCTLSFSSALNSVLADYLSLKDTTSVAATTGTTTFDGCAWAAVNQATCKIEYFQSDVSTGNDTIKLSCALTSDFLTDNYINPLKDGDSFQILVRSGDAAPTGLALATTYYVVSSTKATIKVAATAGGSAINITGTGSAAGGWIVPTYNPYATLDNYAVGLANDPSRFQNVSSVQMRNVRYFSSGPFKQGTLDSDAYRESAKISKYDGQVHCIAGLPKPYFNAADEDTSGGPYVGPEGDFTPGSITLSDEYWYRARFAWVDKAGNYILGPFSEPRSGASSGGAVNGKYRVGVSSTHGGDMCQRLGAQGGFGVMVHGSPLTQLSLPGTVTDGFGNPHTLSVGDIIYFWDSRQGRFIQREITAVASNISITMSAKSLDTDVNSPNYDDGGIPTMLDQCTFSANMRILIYRTVSILSAAVVSPQVDSSKPYYLVGEFPYISPMSQYFYDQMDDTLLGDSLLEPRYQAGPAPRAKYLDKFNDNLLASGDDGAPNTIYYDDIESPEGFPPGTHSFDLPGVVTAVKQTAKSIFAATDIGTLHAIDGDLSNFNFVVDEIASNVFCRSHDSLTAIDEGVLVFETSKGPHVLYGGRKLTPLGYLKYSDDKVASRIEPYFTANYTNATNQPAWSRSIGFFIPDDRIFVLFVPMETSALGYSVRSSTVGTGSLAFTYDFGRDKWRRWSNVDFSAACVQNNRIYSASRTKQSGYIPLVLNRQMQRDAGAWCFADHDEAILWKWQTHWEHLGQPGILKKFLRARISCHEAQASATASMDLNSYINFNPTLQSNDDTLSWSSSIIDLLPKLVSEKVRAIMLEFTAQRFHEAVPISGYELEAVAPFRQIFKE